MTERETTVPAPGPGSTSRASVACQRCRARKVKCDAQGLPLGQSCSPCQRAGQECLLDAALDGRRSVSRKHIDELQQRIQYLESLAQQSRDANDPTPKTGSLVAEGISPPLPSFTNGPRHSPARRAESIAEDLSGFFGTTSHPHVGTPVAQYTVANASETIDIGIHTGSPHLEKHLMHSFFNYQNLWVEVVNKENFLVRRSRGIPSAWYCSLLENAILACATRLATSNAVRALGNEYLQLAKAEILNALQAPTPASLQALLLLSEYEVTHGHDRIGWMFCGMACRMVSDLGLHEVGRLKSHPNTSNQQGTTTHESDLAYALLASCIVYEGVWTLYLGRPTSIPKSLMDIAHERCNAKLEVDSPSLNAWLGLCVPMAEISHILNSRITSHATASISLPRLTAQIQEWYDDLGPGLAYEEGQLTNLDMAGYGLHTQYCKVQILLRKAYDLSPNPQKRKLWQATDNTTEEAAGDAGHEIYKYAFRIARLVVTYREVFGVDKIPSIMLDNAVVAATGLIKYFNRKSDTHDVRDQDLDWIRLLIKTLEAVKPHFPITKRMLDTLGNVTEDDALNALFGMPSSGIQMARHDSSNQFDRPATNPCEPQPRNATRGSDGPMWSAITDEEAIDVGFWDGLDDMFSGPPFSMSLSYDFHSMTDDRALPLSSNT